EAGLRYDWNMTPTEAEDRFVVFDAATASLVRVGSGGRDVIFGQNHNLQPRAGLIWTPSPSGKTVVRASYAILVDQPVTNMVTPPSGNPPLATPLPFPGPIRLSSAVATAGAAGLAPQSVDPDFQNARLQSWNVNVQRELWRGMAAMVGYFGSKGDRL